MRLPQKALCAYTVISRMGFDARQVAANLAGYTVSGQRQKIVEKNGVLFIEDCYNAAPASMKAAVDTLKLVSKGRTIAVFGDMMELGDDEAALHSEVGRYAAQKGVDCMWTWGERAKYICTGFGPDALNFETKQQLTDYIIENIKPGDGIVFKASHSRRFEDIIDRVYNGLEK